MKSDVNLFEEKSFHSKKYSKNKVEEDKQQIKELEKDKKIIKSISVDHLKKRLVEPKEILEDRYRKSKEEVQNKITRL